MGSGGPTVFFVRRSQPLGQRDNRRHEPLASFPAHSYIVVCTLKQCLAVSVSQTSTAVRKLKSEYALSAYCDVAGT